MDGRGGKGGGGGDIIPFSKRADEEKAQSEHPKVSLSRFPLLSNTAVFPICSGFYFSRALADAISKSFMRRQMSALRANGASFQLSLPRFQSLSVRNVIDYAVARMNERSFSGEAHSAQRRVRTNVVTCII